MKRVVLTGFMIWLLVELFVIPPAIETVAPPPVPPRLKAAAPLLKVIDPTLVK